VTNVLPNGWSTAYLGDVFDILDHLRKPINADERATRQGDVPYYGATGQVDWIDGFLFDEELILLGEDGAPFLESSKPKAYVIRGRSWVNNHAHVLRALSSSPSSFWKNQLDTVAYAPFVSGTTRLKLPQGRMKQIPLLVPPREEQYRLTEALDSYLSRLDDAVASLERVQTKLKAYRASVLKAAVEGRLVPTEASLARAEKRDYEPAEALLARVLKERRRRWEEAELAKLKAAGKTPKGDNWKARYEEPVAPDTSTLPELPEGWCWASPGQLSSADVYSLGIGPFGSNLKVSDYTTAGTPLVFVRNIRAETFDDDGAAHYVSAKKADELRPHQVLPGDILITKMGDPPGDCCQYPLSRPSGVITADCIKLRLHPNVLSAGFFVSAIRSGLVQSQIHGMTKGVAQKKVSLGRFRRLALPLPPATEQQRIADKLESLLSVANQTMLELEGSLRRCSRLRQAILKWAFEGKLADQDPSDEPADKLLAHIRAERVAVAPTKKSRGRTVKGAA
jgi:type I restriction enzyme S subunit